MCYRRQSSRMVVGPWTIFAPCCFLDGDLRIAALARHGKVRKNAGDVFNVICGPQAVTMTRRFLPAIAVFVVACVVCVGVCCWWGTDAPPPLLHSNHPCIVSGGGGGGDGTVTFRFANLLRRSDTELLLCICWLDKVVLLVVLCTSDFWHPRPSTVPCIMQNTSVLAISAMDVDQIDTYPAGAVVNFKRSGGSFVPAKILGRSKRGVDDRTITYERSGTVVMHDCAPIAQMMSVVCVPTPPRPTPALLLARYS